MGFNPGNNAQIDSGSYTKSLLAVSSADFTTLVTVAANPITHAILADLGGGIFPSSLAMEIPSGAVNGVNTVFTVQHVPVFADVSGQVMVSQTQDPTNYGFSVSGSSAPYTLTFSNAPTQTPHSFYSAGSSGGSLASFFQIDQFTSTANQTVFTTTLTPVFVFSFTVNDQPQTPTVDYIQTGSTFTLNAGIPAGLPVTIVYLHT